MPFQPEIIWKSVLNLEVLHFKESISFSGSEEKLSVCKRYGANVTINYKTSDFVAKVLSATGKKGQPISVNYHVDSSVYVCHKILASRY